jgi:hypothetical protein
MRQSGGAGASCLAARIGRAALTDCIFRRPGAEKFALVGRRGPYPTSGKLRECKRIACEILTEDTRAEGARETAPSSRIAAGRGS